MEDTAAKKRDNDGDWGKLQLPSEIWDQIDKRLQSRLDLVRLRSVCKSWRSSLPPRTRFPLRVPPIPITHRYSQPELPIGNYFIHERTFFKSKTDRANSMLALFEGANNSGDKFIPSVFLPIQKLPDAKIPQIISCGSLLSKFYKVRIVGRQREFAGTQYAAPKTVFIFSNSEVLDPNLATKRDVTVVARLFCGSLAFLRLGDGLYLDPLRLNWEVHFGSTIYKDIISYNGKLVAVDTSGGAFAMDYGSLRMTQVAAPLFTVRKEKFKEKEFVMQLVEAVGHLYLFVSDPGVDLKIYELNSEAGKWCVVKDLGDRVFVLHQNHGFSADKNVFADTGFMDLKCKRRVRSLHPATHQLVFSHRSRHCVIAIGSIPCVDSIAKHNN